ncbi:MAG: hypothetical protein KAX18_00145 [Candidatus Lokiarchaeota archaeon]|nr:hypothetical protein [Candidatus Lokiarchaeota archaeon]
MTQAYEEVMEVKSLEVEEIEHPEVQRSEVDELLGDLNPRYYEEIISLNEAQERVYSSDINFSNQFNIFRTF